MDYLRACKLSWYMWISILCISSATLCYTLNFKKSHWGGAPNVALQCSRHTHNPERWSVASLELSDWATLLAQWWGQAAHIQRLQSLCSGRGFDSRPVQTFAPCLPHSLSALFPVSFTRIKATSAQNLKKKKPFKVLVEKKTTLP